MNVYAQERQYNMLGQLFFTVVSSPIGKIQILSLKEKSEIVKLDFLDSIDFLKSKNRDYGAFMRKNYQNYALVKSENAKFGELLNTYFLDSDLEKKDKALQKLQSLCVQPESVIKGLSSIPIGTALSPTKYAKLIELEEIKSVPSKITNNAIPLIFPCHRIVVQKNIINEREILEVGSYVAQSNIKKALLELEGVKVG